MICYVYLGGRHILVYIDDFLGTYSTTSEFQPVYSTETKTWRQQQADRVRG